MTNLGPWTLLRTLAPANNESAEPDRALSALPSPAEPGTPQDIARPRQPRTLEDTARPRPVL